MKDFRISKVPLMTYKSNSLSKDKSYMLVQNCPGLTSIRTGSDFMSGDTSSNKMISEILEKSSVAPSFHVHDFRVETKIKKKQS